MNFIEFLKGKKSYLLAFALVAYTVGGYFSGYLDAQTALGLLFSSGVITSLRAAIAKSAPTINLIQEAVQQTTPAPEAPKVITPQV